MTSYPIGRYLVQFGLEEELAEAAAAETLDPVLQPLSLSGAKLEEFHDNHVEQLEVAREEGRNEGHERAHEQAQAHFDTVLADLQADYAKQLSNERETWIAEESSKLETGLASAIAQLQEQLAEATDAVLRPFLIETLRRQMIDELASDVNVLLSSECPAIEISGAADLLVALREKLSSAHATIDYKPDESTDVRIVAHHTIIESQLGAWIERFMLPKEQN